MAESKKTKNLTETRIERQKAPDNGQMLLWDKAVPGLALRVTPSGAKAFVFQKRFQGRSFRITIGDWPAWSLEKAQKRARKLQRLIDKNINPKEYLAQEAAKGETVGEVWRKYMKANKRRWGARHMADHLYLSKAPKDEHPGGVLVPLLEKKLSEIDARAIEHWARNALKAPSRSKANRGHHTAVRQGFVRLRAFWRWAFEKDKYKGSMIHPDVFRNSSFKRVIPATRAKKDTLEKSQLKAWFENVGEIANPVIAGYLQCLLLTGARRNELAKVKWTDIDFQWRKIHLHDKVREEGRDIPLTPYVGFLLNSLERKGEYVFHSANSKTGYIAEPRFGHKKALKNAGISTELSLHGLRRSFATLNEWVESPAGVIAQIQGHAASAVQERHYKNRPLELLAKWHVKFEAWVLEQSEIEFNEQAVQEGLHAV